MARTRLISLPYAGEGKELKAAVGPWGRIPRIPFSCPLLTRRRRRSRGWWII